MSQETLIDPNKPIIELSESQKTAESIVQQSDIETPKQHAESIIYKMFADGSVTESDPTNIMGELTDMHKKTTGQKAASVLKFGMRALGSTRNLFSGTMANIATTNDEGKISNSSGKLAKLNNMRIKAIEKSREFAGANHPKIMIGYVKELSDGFSKPIASSALAKKMFADIAAGIENGDIKPGGLVLGRVASYANMLVSTNLAKNTDHALSIIKEGNKEGAVNSQYFSVITKMAESASKNVNIVINNSLSEDEKIQKRNAETFAIIEGEKSTSRKVLGSMVMAANLAKLSVAGPFYMSMIVGSSASRSMVDIFRKFDGSDIAQNNAAIARLVYNEMEKENPAEFIEMKQKMADKEFGKAYQVLDTLEKGLIEKKMLQAIETMASKKSAIGLDEAIERAKPQNISNSKVLNLLSKTATGALKIVLGDFYQEKKGAASIVKAMLDAGDSESLERTQEGLGEAVSNVISERLSTVTEEGARRERFNVTDKKAIKAAAAVLSMGVIGFIGKQAFGAVARSAALGLKADIGFESFNAEGITETGFDSSLGGISGYGENTLNQFRYRFEAGANFSVESFNLLKEAVDSVENSVELALEDPSKFVSTIKGITSVGATEVVEQAKLGSDISVSDFELQKAMENAKSVGRSGVNNQFVLEIETETGLRRIGVNDLEGVTVDQLKDRLVSNRIIDSEFVFTGNDSNMQYDPEAAASYNANIGSTSEPSLEETGTALRDGAASRLEQLNERRKQLQESGFQAITNTVDDAKAVSGIALAALSEAPERLNAIADEVLDLNPSTIKGSEIGLPATLEIDTIDGGTQISIVGKAGKELIIQSDAIDEYLKHNDISTLSQTPLFMQEFNRVLNEDPKVSMEDFDSQFWLYQSEEQLKPFESLDRAKGVITKSGIIQTVLKNDTERLYSTPQGTARMLFDNMYNAAQEGDYEAFIQAQDLFRAFKTLDAKNGAMLDWFTYEELDAINEFKGGVSVALGGKDGKIPDGPITPRILQTSRAILFNNQLDSADLARQDVLGKYAQAFLDIDGNVLIDDKDRRFLESLVEKAADGEDFSHEELKRGTDLIIKNSKPTSEAMRHTLNDSQLSSLRSFTDSAVTRLSEINDNIYASIEEKLESNGFVQDPENPMYYTKTVNGKVLRGKIPTNEINATFESSLAGLTFSEGVESVNGETVYTDSFSVDPFEFARFGFGLASGSFNISGGSETDITRVFTDFAMDDISIVFDTAEKAYSKNPEIGVRNGNNFGLAAVRLLSTFNKIRDDIPFLPDEAKNFWNALGAEKGGEFTILGDLIPVGDTASEQMADSGIIEGMSNVEYALYQSVRQNPDVTAVLGHVPVKSVVINGEEQIGLSPYDAFMKFTSIQSANQITDPESLTYTIVIDGEEPIEISYTEYNAVLRLDKALGENPLIAKAIITAEGLERAQTPGSTAEGVHEVTFGKLVPSGIYAEDEVVEALQMRPKDKNEAMLYRALNDFYEKGDEYKAILSSEMQDNGNSFTKLLDHEGMGDSANIRAKAEDLGRSDLPDGSYVFDGNELIVKGKGTGGAWTYGTRVGFFDNTGVDQVSVISLSDQEKAEFIAEIGKDGIVDPQSFKELSRTKPVVSMLLHCNNGNIAAPVEANTALEISRKVKVEAVTRANGSQLTTNISATNAHVNELKNIGSQITLRPLLRMNEGEAGSIDRMNNAFGNLDRNLSFALVAVQQANQLPEGETFDFGKFLSENTESNGKVDFQEVAKIYDMYMSDPNAIPPVIDTNLATQESGYYERLQFALRADLPSAEVISREIIPGTDWMDSNIPGVQVKLLDGEIVTRSKEGMDFNFNGSLSQREYVEAVAYQATVVQSDDGSSTLKYIQTAADGSKVKKEFTFGGGGKLEDKSVDINQEEITREVSKPKEDIVRTGDEAVTPGLSDAPVPVSGAPEVGVDAEGQAIVEPGVSAQPVGESAAPAADATASGENAPISGTPTAQPNAEGAAPSDGGADAQGQAAATPPAVTSSGEGVGNTVPGSADANGSVQGGSNSNNIGQGGSNSEGGSLNNGSANQGGSNAEGVAEGGSNAQAEGLGLGDASQGAEGAVEGSLGGGVPDSTAVNTNTNSGVTQIPGGGSNAESLDGASGAIGNSVAENTTVVGADSASITSGEIATSNDVNIGGIDNSVGGAVATFNADQGVPVENGFGSIESSGITNSGDFNPPQEIDYFPEVPTTPAVESTFNPGSVAPVESSTYVEQITYQEPISYQESIPYEAVNTTVNDAFVAPAEGNVYVPPAETFAEDLSPIAPAETFVEDLPLTPTDSGIADIQPPLDPSLE